MTVSSGVSATGIRQSVHAAVTHVLERDGIDPDIDLFDQGMTSLAFIRIVARLNEQYDVKLKVAELEEASINALSELIDAHVGATNN